MSPLLRLAPVAALVASSFSAQALTAGVVADARGRAVEHAKVCVDRNRNARCDAREPAAWSDTGGRFALAGSGALVAEIGTDAQEVDGATGAKTPVPRPLVFLAPAGSRALDPLSTELQAMAGTGGARALAQARAELSERLGVASLDAGEDGDDGVVERARSAERAFLVDRIADATAEAGARGDRRAALRNRLDLREIRNVVVIYAENHSFNNLFANFPGARGVKAGGFAPQKDRDGSVLAKLPAVWSGLTAAGQAVAVTQAQTTNVLPNAPFLIDAVQPAWGAPALANTAITRDLYHRFFENQMQIAGGANDQFAAWGDSGGLVMGFYDGSRTALWKLARQYTLADDFFQGAFGGSFLNHQYLVCACAPEYPDADTAPAHPSIAVLDPDANGGWTARLALAANSPPSALAGPPVFKRSGNLTPKDYFGDASFRAVNTMQPAYQPGANPPPAGDASGKYADPAAPNTLPAQTISTIGDLLDTRALSWTWYAGGWNEANADRTKVYDDKRGSFQAHHQPFNYYAALDPASKADARAKHLKDYVDLVADARAGRLPAVTFYKPVGTYNEHPGYASLGLGDAHIADLVAQLQASPQWAHMLVVITYDENGGQWDEVAPPPGDRLGPGTRVPAVILSPFARRGWVDHTPYDTGSVLRFITHRFSLPELAGLRERDAALEAHGAPAMGDLTNALDFRQR